MLCLGNITISFNIAAITAAIPLISLDLGKPDILVSKIISYYLLPYGLGALIYAPLTRVVSYRIVLAVSMAMYALANFWAGGLHSLNHLLIARVIMGITAAGAIPIALMIIGETFEKRVRGRLVGIFFGCSFFSSLSGVIIGGVAHWRHLFYIPAVLAVGVVISLVVLNSAVLNHVHKAEVNYFKVIRKIDVRNLFLFIFLISFLYHGLHKWFGIYLSTIYGMDKLAITFFFISMAVGGLMGQLLGGVISDKKGRNFSCYSGVIGLGILAMLLGKNDYSPIVLGAILTGISMFWTIGHNGISTVLTDFPACDRAVLASLNSSIRFISGGLGFWISHFFVTLNFGLTFSGIGILIIVLLLIIPKLIKFNN